MSIGLLVLVATVVLECAYSTGDAALAVEHMGAGR